MLVKFPLKITSSHAYIALIKPMKMVFEKFEDHKNLNNVLMKYIQWTFNLL